MYVATGGMFQVVGMAASLAPFVLMEHTLVYSSTASVLFYDL